MPIWSPEASSLWIMITRATNWERLSVTQPLTSDLAMGVSNYKYSKSEVQYGWWWGHLAIGLVSMWKSYFEAGGTPIGCSKMSANAYLMHSPYASGSAGLCGVASTSSLIMSICSRILMMKISNDFHLATKNAVSILITDIPATVRQWAQTSLNSPWWGRRSTSYVMIIVEGRQEPCCKLVQLDSSIWIVFDFWLQICKSAAIQGLHTIKQ